MTSSTEAPQPAPGDAPPEHHNHRVISAIFTHIPHPHILHRKRNAPKPKDPGQMGPIGRFNTFLGVKITDATCGLKLISRRFIPLALKLPTEDMHAELIVGLARCGASIREVKITVTPREAGESMYHFHKALFYPPKTMICLIGELMFCRQLRKTLDPSLRLGPRKPEARPAGGAP